MSNEKPPQSHRCDELRTFQDAVWDFMLEHCDITENGAFFVKFHISDRRNFENRIKARWKYDYHRIDDRTGFDNRQKEADAMARRAAHESRKQAKKRHHILSREEQRKAHEALRQERLAKEAQMSPVINTEEMQPLAQSLYTRIKLWLKSKQQSKSSNAH